MALPELKSNILPDNEIITTHTQDGAEVISQLQDTNNSVESYVSAGNPVYTTHNVVPQVLTVLKENGQDITTIVEGFWDVVWSVNGQTGDVTLDMVVGDFIPNHTYRKNSAIYHNGNLYAAKADFTTSTAFVESNWNEIQPTSSGVFNVFQPNHFYLARQPIWQDGSIYVANQDFTSGETFDPSNWTKASGGGSWGEIEGDITDQTDLLQVLNTKQNKTDIATSTVAGVTKLYTSKGTNTDGALTQKAVGDNYFPLTGGTLNDNAYIELLQWGQRKIKVTGNDITLDMSNVTGGWASTFAKMIDSVGTPYDMVGIFGGNAGLNYFYFGGTYSSPALKMTAADQVYTFKNRPYVGSVRLALESDTNALGTRVTAIEGKIPSQASTTNQLADKDFVNSTVQTGTANFRGNWENWSSVPTDPTQYPVDYAGSHTPTVNDYLVVRDASDYSGETLEGTWRFKYSGVWATEGKSGWNPEYQVNETPMTAAQLAALNSGITQQTWDSINSTVGTNSTNIVNLDRVKVDKVEGKELSTNDFSNEDKSKLDGIAAGAEVNVQSDWSQADTSADDYIKNKPTIPAKTLWYASCSTASATQTKVATTSTGDFTLTTGAQVNILMSSNNTYNGKAKLNVDNTGAKELLPYVGASTTRYFWRSNEVISAIYDGTRFVMVDSRTADVNSYGLTKLSSAVDSTSAELSATPAAVKTAYDLANTKATVTVTTTDPGEGATIGTNEIIAVPGAASSVFPVGSIYQSQTLTTASAVASALGGSWTLVNTDYDRQIREIHDIAMGVDTSRTGDGNVGKTAVSGAYNYSLLESSKNATVPSGYHREYNVSAEIKTGGGNNVTIYINNIASNAAGTWSIDTFHNVVSTGWFKQSDITLTTTLGYSNPGCNFYYAVAGSASTWRIWKPQVIVADALNDPIYIWKRTA